ncbi:unnamed protein product [Cyclocybe aegerita]|uniref:Uncharacterized protein n=1 Tax=Cyclocybe aegerita TaxID=1973307 RepID=A0A8S0WH67_CYCAE|nr:unnamed protein product [Cyclocybe aegerita]
MDGASADIREVGIAQPSPTPNAITAPPRTTQNLPGRRRRPRRILSTVLAILKIGFVYIIPGAFFLVLATAIFLGLPFSVLSAYGALVMFVGNAILRAAPLDHYTTHELAAAIGATGSPFACIIVAIVLQCLPRQLTETDPPRYARYARRPRLPLWGDSDSEQDTNPAGTTVMPWYTAFLTTVVVNTLGAVIGCRILLLHHVDLKGMDTLHAARAGTLGGAVMGFGTVFAGPVIMDVLSIILAPVWSAMLLAVNWVYVRSKETWTKRLRPYSGRQWCGANSDADQEVEGLQRGDA